MFTRKQKERDVTLAHFSPNSSGVHRQLFYSQPKKEIRLTNWDW
jgi:hypothetical protein